MTFSIVGRSTDPSGLGVAVASKFLAVGAAVPAAQLPLGAIATQSFCNTLYKRDGLELLADGRTAQQTLDQLLAGDHLSSERQVGVVDANGGSATYTGTGCLDWAGGIAEQDVAVQGNDRPRGRRADASRLGGRLRTPARRAVDRCPRRR